MAGDKVLRAIEEDALAKKATTAANSDPEDTEEFDLSSLLPEKVRSIIGEIPYELFKSRYESVFEDILNGEHLVSGYVLFSLQIGKIAVSVRGLTKKEAAFCASFYSMENDDQFAAAMGLDEASRYRLALSVRSVNSMTFPVLPAVGSDWMNDDTVKQVLDTIDGWDETFTMTLVNLLGDIEEAKRLAIQESLIHP